VPITELPHADKTKPDPLTDPKNYTQPGVPEKVAEAAPSPAPAFQLPSATKTAQAPTPKPVPTPKLTADAVTGPAQPKLTPEPCATTGPCSPCTPCVACQECTKRRFLFWTFDSCKACKNECVVCQPAAKCDAPCASTPATPVVSTPAQHNPTFAEKFQAGQTEAQARRDTRPKVVAVKPAAPSRELTKGAKSVVAAADGAPGASMPMPVPVIVIPPVRNQQAVRPAKPQMQVAQQTAPPIPRSEIENAFTEIEPVKGGKRSRSQAQPAVENEDVNAFYTPPENVPDGELTRNMYAWQYQAVGQYPGYGYAPSGMGMFPYGFNQAAAYGARPQMAMARPPMVMVPGPVYADVPMQGPISEARAAQRPAKEPNVDVPHLLTLLKSALYPSHREWAADNLAVLDWHKHPQVVEALMKAAKEDPAATVRTGCIRGLGTMNVNNPAVVAMLEGLKSDTSPQVVQEANRVLTQFAANKTAGMNPAGRATITR
jgi:hypothetical protein